MTVKGVYGSRMTGGGFGGCTVTLAHKDCKDALVEAIRKGWVPRAGSPIAPPCQAAAPRTHAPDGRWPPPLNSWPLSPTAGPLTPLASTRPRLSPTSPDHVPLTRR